MIENYFGLTRQPFKLGTDTGFFFESEIHRKAMSYFKFGMQQGEGFVLITGDTGVGKSILVEYLLEEIDRSEILAAKMSVGYIDKGAVVDHILQAFRIEASNEGSTAKYDALEAFLTDQLTFGLHAILVIDEAQNLTKSALEEIRILTNLQARGHSLLQVFLIGQNELSDVISSEGMEQLRQRIISSYKIGALSKEETALYIDHRMVAAGWGEEQSAFSEDAHELIYDFTGGVPRRINTLCSRLLMQAAIDEAEYVNSSMVRAVAGELKEERQELNSQQQSFCSKEGSSSPLSDEIILDDNLLLSEEELNSYKDHSLNDNSDHIDDPLLAINVDASSNSTRDSESKLDSRLPGYTPQDQTLEGSLQALKGSDMEIEQDQPFARAHLPNDIPPVLSPPGSRMVFIYPSEDSEEEVISERNDVRASLAEIGRVLKSASAQNLENEASQRIHNGENESGFIKTEEDTAGEVELDQARIDLFSGSTVLEAEYEQPKLAVGAEDFWAQQKAIIAMSDNNRSHQKRADEHRALESSFKKTSILSDFEGSSLDRLMNTQPEFPPLETKNNNDVPPLQEKTYEEVGLAKQNLQKLENEMSSVEQKIDILNEQWRERARIIDERLSQIDDIIKTILDE